MVKLRIYNILGQPVRALVDEAQVAGKYRVLWDAMQTIRFVNQWARGLRKILTTTIVVLAVSGFCTGDTGDKSTLTAMV